MSTGADLRRAIAAIKRAGVLLVFPVTNQKEPASLWKEFYPRKPMSWEWDETGKSGVSRLWSLRAELAQSGQVFYTKWYRGRATVFSRQLFVPILATLGVPAVARNSRQQLLAPTRASALSKDACNLLEILEMDSPLSTRDLKRASGLLGRFEESRYERALKQLWSRLLIVALGEVEEGSIPSLSIGATRLVFEDLWAEAEELSRNPQQAFGMIEQQLPPGSLFLKYYRQLAGV